MDISLDRSCRDLLHRPPSLVSFNSSLRYKDLTKSIRKKGDLIRRLRVESKFWNWTERSSWSVLIIRESFPIRVVTYGEELLPNRLWRLVGDTWSVRSSWTYVSYFSVRGVGRLIVEWVLTRLRGRVRCSDVERTTRMMTITFVNERRVLSRIWCDPISVTKVET